MTNWLTRSGSLQNLGTCSVWDYTVLRRGQLADALSRPLSRTRYLWRYLGRYPSEVMPASWGWLEYWPGSSHATDDTTLVKRGRADEIYPLRATMCPCLPAGETFLHSCGNEKTAFTRIGQGQVYAAEVDKWKVLTPAGLIWRLNSPS